MDGSLGLVGVRTALLSVSDKDGLVPFASALARLGVSIISTGGTAKALRDAGLAVRSVEELTGFPEMLDGRVKTLHPKVHGGLLGRRDEPSHREQMQRHGIEAIDLVCVNLYPFERTVARAGVGLEEAIEQIDIGGPAMIRSASKNAEHVVVVTSPAQYARVLGSLEEHAGATTRALRFELACEAFERTGSYDRAISEYLRRRDSGGEGSPPALWSRAYVKVEDLRYGENPHQRAALYRAVPRGHADDCEKQGTIPGAEQIHGKPLSYNNILDASAALELAWALRRAFPEGVGAAVVKHTNPCGAALAEDQESAVVEALAGDPLAAYGGILAINSPLDEQAARRLADRSIFLEVIAAPAFSSRAVAILQEKSANLRLLACGEAPPLHTTDHPLDARSVPGGLLVQERDLREASAGEFTLRAGPAPDGRTLATARFLECVGRACLSNAVVVGGTTPRARGRLFGAGAGQMDRVTSCRIALEKAGAHASGAVAYSDAFFPFPDGPRLLMDAGVRTIVHPGGSKRDEETFELCGARGVTCLTTGLRHFRH